MTAQRRKQVERDGACPGRTCIASRVVRDPDSLLRFVLSPDGEAVPDLVRSLPGRGAWVTNSRVMLERAIAKRAFDRAWRKKVRVPEDLVGRVHRLLERRALDTLSLANKAGAVTTGFSNVDQRVEDAGSMVLMQAHDASEGGRQKLLAKYRAICEAQGQTSNVIDIFSVEQMSLAIGRSNVVHAALNRGKPAEAVVQAVARLIAFDTDASAADPQNLCKSGMKSPSESANDLDLETEQV